jgi:cobalt-zinc-cadmium efflux system membrane fusion protein
MVARRGVSLGEYVEPSRDLFEVVNTSTVWIDAQVSPQMASTLGIGGTGVIQDQENHRHSGIIRFIAPTVDPESRTVTVRTEVNNPNVHLRPETFVTVDFERSVSGYAIVIPNDAIEQDGTSYYVYREDEQNRFQRIEVKVGRGPGEKTIIETGLKEEDRIAISGIFYLKSARLKGELQEHKH